jgi:hypothetical protein
VVEVVEVMTGRTCAHFHCPGLQVPNSIQAYEVLAGHLYWWRARGMLLTAYEFCEIDGNRS